jgi:hypothetical protein
MPEMRRGLARVPGRLFHLPVLRLFEMQLITSVSH